MKNKIYLDSEGYNEYLREIDSLVEQINIVRGKSFSLKETHSDADSLNEALDELKRQETKLRDRLIQKRNDLKRIEIVETVSSDIINVNDVVNVLLDEDEMTFKLVASNPDFNADIPMITIDSPLGKEVYLKEIGYVGNYTVGKNNIRVEIVSKEKESTLELK